MFYSGLVYAFSIKEFILLKSNKHTAQPDFTRAHARFILFEPFRLGREW